MLAIHFTTETAEARHGTLRKRGNWYFSLITFSTIRNRETDILYRLHFSPLKWKIHRQTLTHIIYTSRTLTCQFWLIREMGTPVPITETGNQPNRANPDETCSKDAHPNQTVIKTVNQIKPKDRTCQARRAHSLFIKNKLIGYRPGPWVSTDSLLSWFFIQSGQCWLM